jgi:probable HAF family extracellular repeat protein
LESAIYNNDEKDIPLAATALSSNTLAAQTMFDVPDDMANMLRIPTQGGASDWVDFDSSTWAPPGAPDYLATDASDAQAALEHEITELMGRVSDDEKNPNFPYYEPLDLFRYAENAQTHALVGHNYQAGEDGLPDVFSVDGKTPSLQFHAYPKGGPADNYDLADWADGNFTNDPVAVTGDAFGGGGPGSGDVVSPVDYHVMEALGWSAIPETPVPPNLTVTWSNTSPNVSGPPDCSIAAGPTSIVTAVNSHIDFYDKKGNEISGESLNKFIFGTETPSDPVSDPHVLWDQFDQRFIVVVSGSGLNPAFYIDVSKDSNPSDGWLPATYLSIAGTENGIQQLTVGLDSANLYIQGYNLLQNPNGPDLISSLLYPLPLTNLVNDQLFSTAPWTTDGLLMPGGHPEFQYAPAHMYGNPEPGVGDFLVNYSLMPGNPAGDLLIITEVSDAAQGIVSPHTYQLNLGHIAFVQPAGARQPGPTPNTPTIDDGDDRIRAAAWQSNPDGRDVLYAVDEIRSQAGDHDVVHWFAVDTTHPNSLQLINQGDIDLGSSLDTYNGNITVDSSGNLIIGYSISGPTQYAGAHYAVIPYAQILAGLPIQVQDNVLAPGQGTYSGTQSTGAVFGVHDGQYSWGDWSGASIDPDGQSFWVFNQYATGTIINGQSNWATTVGGHQIVAAGTGFSSSSISDSNANTQGTVPDAINASGDVTGYYWDQAGIMHGFFSPVQGTLVNLTDPFANATTNHAGYGTKPVAINAADQIVGDYWDVNGVSHGFLYSGGQFTNLAGPNSPPSSSATSINSSNQVVGTYTTSLGENHGFMYQNGSYTTIDDPLASFINGEVFAGTGGIPSSSIGYGTVLLGNNDAGEILGCYFDSTDTLQGFLDINGTYFTLTDPSAGTGNGEGTLPVAMNNNGDVVGEYTNSAGSVSFLYTNGTYFDIRYPGSVSTTVTGINDSGQIVGSYVDSRGVTHGFVVTNGGYFDVGSASAAAINASGVIVGTYQDSNGVSHGVSISVKDTTAPTIVNDRPLAFAAGVTTSIGASFLSSVDADNPSAQLTYTVTAGPSHGTLLKNGLPISSFTQADIDNGLISYQEDGSVAASDSFVFKVSDPVGNHTANTAFQLQTITGQLTLSAATEAVALPGTTQIATFSDTNTNDAASVFTAVINWGDGLSSLGTVSGSNGSFTVSGGHTYARTGSLPLDVSITDPSNAADLALSGAVTVNFPAPDDFIGNHTSDVLFRNDTTGAWGWSDIYNNLAWHDLEHFPERLNRGFP